MQLAVQRRRLAVGPCPGVSKPAFHIFPIERRRQFIKRKAAAADLKLAVRSQRFVRRRWLVAATLEPCDQRFQIGRLNAGGAVENQALRAVVEPPAHIDVREPGRAERKIADAPAVLVKVHVAMRRLNPRAADGQRIDGDADGDRQRRVHRADKRFQKAPEHDEGRPVGDVGSRQHPVDVDRHRRNRAVEMRMRAECKLRLAGEIHRALIGPVLHGEIPQRRRGRRGANLAGKLPRIAQHPLAARERRAGRPGQRQRAVELRNAAIEMENTLDFGGQRKIGRIDAEPDLQAAVLIDMTAGDPIAVELVAGDEAPSPWNGPTKERMSPLNETFCSTRRAPDSASVSVTCPSSTLKCEMASASGRMTRRAPANRSRRSCRGRD